MKDLVYGIISIACFLPHSILHMPVKSLPRIFLRSQDMQRSKLVELSNTLAGLSFGIIGSDHDDQIIVLFNAS